jgi:hypothetical protein
MRWAATDPPKPRSGEVRIRRKFAWKPRRVEDCIVWLESYEIYETFFEPASGSPGWWSVDREALYNPVYYC